MPTANEANGIGMSEAAPRAGRAQSRRAEEGRVLVRASSSSLVATAVDGAAYQLILFGGFGYVVAALGGAVLGAIVNFTLNRAWAFGPGGRSLGSQIALYAFASLLTYLGLQACLAVFVEVLHVAERLAWVPAKILAWGAISYPLFRWVVFARPRAAPGSRGGAP
jgi:putative flippase GtrA